MRGKLGNVVAALGECRHFERKDIQAVEQILPESSLFDLFLQIAVGGGNDPHAHLDLGVRAEPLDLSLLNHAQKIRLHAEGKLADFVQEHRAAIPSFEQSFSLSGGAGESALSWPNSSAADCGFPHHSPRDSQFIHPPLGCMFSSS